MSFSFKLYKKCILPKGILEMLIIPTFDAMKRKQKRPEKMIHIDSTLNTDDQVAVSLKNKLTN